MIKACSKRLIVAEIEEKEEKKSVLILPTQRDQVRAVVVSVGSEVDKNIKTGDIVYLPLDTGIQVEIWGQEMLSITENQILAAVDEKDV
jgi:co-chaperonin GroES (HSP10)